MTVFGGDTLLNICSKLGIKKIRVIDQISLATEVGISESKFGKLIIISKGGSVGNINIIPKIIEYFR